MLGLLVALGALHCAQDGRPDPFAEAVAMLRRSTTPGPSGEQHALLVSLRTMKDPALRPLFDALLQADEWSMRVDGLLALAELSEGGKLEPALLWRLSAEEDRSIAMQSAISLELVDLECARALLQATDLPPRDRTLLSAFLDLRGKAWDPAPIRAIAGSPELSLSDRATAALLLLGETPQPFEALRAELEALPPSQRNTALQELTRFAHAQRIHEALDPLAALAASDEITAATRAMVNGMALALDRRRGLEAWTAFVQAQRGQAQLVRSGLQLLLHAEGLPPGCAAPLRNGDVVVETIADAIEASAKGDHAASAAAMAGLITMGLPTVAEWAHRASRSLPDAQVAAIDRAVIEAAGADDGAGIAATRSLIPQAARSLSKVDPNWLVEALRSTTDQLLQELLLLGCVTEGGEHGGAVARRVRGTLSRRGEALALLALAKAERLDGPDLAALGDVAAGGGDIDPTLRVQAAWLFASQSGRQEQALAGARP